MTHKHDRCSQIWDGRKGNLARPKGAVQCVTFTQKHRLSVQECLLCVSAVTCSSQHGFKCVPEGTTQFSSSEIQQRRCKIRICSLAKIIRPMLKHTCKKVAALEMHTWIPEYTRGVVNTNTDANGWLYCRSKSCSATFSPKYTLSHKIVNEWSCLDIHQVPLFHVVLSFFP